MSKINKVNEAIKAMVNFIGSDDDYIARDQQLRKALSEREKLDSFPPIIFSDAGILSYVSRFILALHKYQPSAVETVLQICEQGSISKTNPILEYTPFKFYKKKYGKLFSKIKYSAFMVHVSLKNKSFTIWNCQNLWELMQQFEGFPGEFKKAYCFNHQDNKYVHEAKFEPILIALNFLVAMSFHCKMTGKAEFSIDDLRQYSDKEFPDLDYRFTDSSLGAIKYAVSDFLGRFYDLPTTGGKTKKAKLFSRIFEGKSRRSLQLLIPLEQISIEISPENVLGFGI